MKSAGSAYLSRLLLSASLAALLSAGGLVSLSGCAVFQGAADKAEGDLNAEADKAQDKVDGETGAAKDQVAGAQADVENQAQGAKDQAAGAQSDLEGKAQAAKDLPGNAQGMVAGELDKKVPGLSKDLGLKRSLYDRSGGKAAMDAVASDFVDFLSQHPSMKADQKIADALARDPAHHKQMLSDYLCRVAGGPCLYSGKAMKQAHASMKVTADQWKAMGSLFIKALRKNNVPKAERAELATLVAANKPLIVAP